MVSKIKFFNRKANIFILKIINIMAGFIVGTAGFSNCMLPQASMYGGQPVGYSIGLSRE